MKYSIKTIISAYCILIVTSCNQRTGFNSFHKFPIEETKPFEIIQVPPVLYNIREMLLLDSALLTIDGSADTIVRIFKPKTFEYEGWAIKKGKGPNEEVYVYYEMQNLGKNRFMYQTINAIKMASYEGGNVVVKKKVYMPGELRDFNRAFLFNDLIYGYDFMSPSRFEYIEYDFKKKNIQEFGPIHPKVEGKIRDDKKNLAYNRRNTINDCDSIFAAAYFSFPIVRIYDSAGNVTCETRYENKQNFPTLYSVKNPSNEQLNVMVNYIGIKSTKKYIYCLYAGLKREDFMNVYDLQENKKCEIHIFNWKGKPIRNIKLNVDLNAFCVEKNDSFVIGCSNSNLNEFYRIDLN